MNNITGITGSNMPGYGGTDTARAGSGSGAEFSQVLEDALREEMTRSVTAGMSGGVDGMLGGYMPSPTSGIEQAIITAAESGEVSDAQVALFMLLMMMQTGGGEGDSSMLMQMMAATLTQIQGDTEGLRNTMLKSEYNPLLLDTMDRQVFGARDMAGPGGAVLPVAAWRPATPVATSHEGNRNSELYSAVIDQFNVETAERYRPYRNGDTYCNIFMWDVTAAMGAEIPHWADSVTGEPRSYPDTDGATELNAVAIDEWLRKHGPAYGWREVDAETAQRYANEGKPAVTTAGQNRHVQVVCPSEDGGYDRIRGVTVAQAGARVTNYTHISSIYSSNGMKSVRYFVHD